MKNPSPGPPPPWGTGPTPPEVIQFLAGPQKRGFELRLAVRVFLEMIRGFRALHFVGPCVTVFGSARIGRVIPRGRFATTRWS